MISVKKKLARLTFASLLVRMELKSDPALTFVPAQGVEALVLAAVLLQIGAFVVLWQLFIIII